MSLNYNKWDAIDSSDDEAAKRKTQVVRKQAHTVTAAEERAAAEEIARRAAEEGARLQGEVARWTRKLEEKEAAAANAAAAEVDGAGSAPAAQAGVGAAGREEAGCPGEAAGDCISPTDAPAEANALQQQEEPLRDASDESLGTRKDSPTSESDEPKHMAQKQLLLGDPCGIEAEGDSEEQSATEGEDGADRHRSPTPSSRRRGLDALWEVEKEREFEARPSPDGGRGEAIAAELRKRSEEAAAAGKAKEAAAKERAARPPSPPGTGEVVGSSLRRLKKLEAAAAGSIEQECGVTVGKSDVFRLVLEHPTSKLKKQTRCLIIAAGDAFLCEAPISEEPGAPEEGGAAAAEVQAEQAAEPQEEERCRADEAEATTVGDETAVGELTAEASREPTEVLIATQPAADPAAEPPAEPPAVEGASTPSAHGPHVTENDRSEEAAAATTGDASIVGAQPAEASKEPTEAAAEVERESAPAAAAAEPEAADAEPAAAETLPAAAAESTEAAAEVERESAPAAADAELEAAEAEPAAAETEPAAAAESTEAGPAASNGEAVSSSLDPRPSAGLPQDLDGGTDNAGGVLELACFFFRAKPSHLRLAKKLRKIPVLHVALKTNDGLVQAMEFIGIHQRRYLEEDYASDAIAKNLVESLLKVVLEFVLHPSRTRYAKERVILRECSTSAEVRKSRGALFPGMVAQVKRINDRIQHVDIEFCDGLARQHHFARGKKDRSFLILDEDVLKVAPVRRELAKAPSANGAFKGLGQGFLNSDRARRRGLADQRRQDQGGRSSSAGEDNEQKAGTPEAEQQATDKGVADASGEMSAGDTDSELVKSIKASERTRINSSSSSSGGPSGIETTLEERLKLVMGSADTNPGKVPEDIMRSVRSAASAGGAAAVAAAASSASSAAVAASSSSAGGNATGTGSADPAVSAAEDEEEVNADEQPPSLSDLANRLFGNDLEIDMLASDEAASDGGAGPLTESTKTPSPKASSRGGGAPSERSEPVTEDGADTAENAAAPAAGIRLLQQRRKERGGIASSGSGAAAGGSHQAASSSSSQKDESDDLVSLWMKQRW